MNGDAPLVSAPLADRRALRVASLAIGHADRMLARGIDFELAAAEVVAILGPNGAGKTTLLRTLLGAVPAQHGTVRLDAEDIHALSPAARARAVAWVPQSAMGGFDFDVLDYVAFARTPHLAWYAAPAARDRAIARDALARVGMEGVAARSVATLSGGERQLVTIARALASGAAILLMDEPTASLDFGNRARVLDVIAALARDGYAVLFSTHHPEAALRIAHRTLTLARDGAVRYGRTPAVVTAAHLTDLYGIPVSLVGAADGRIVPIA